VHIAIAHPNAAIVLFAEHQRFAVVEFDHGVVADASVGEHLKCVIVEDVAVLIDLDKRNPFVVHCALDDHLKMRRKCVNRPADERRLGSKSYR
jgi:hypothetical protein